ncbi:sugar O-acetyltransferase [Cellulomonas sp. DKR-3]|uniref:Acetyltransferase n=1 Tax=Cellulomonas fulva TaxID=2835530 RepID=A0ABS5TX99_9CELL|nr:DapH/DapD/GlmU-related protein [Cellulomonas fulva]MBT0993780.1 sugar O-acetyltransferase [Cellulomonas fulva]
MTTDYFAGDPRTNRERMLAGDLYIADDPESERIARAALRLADAYHRAEVAGEPDARAHLLELLGTLGEGAYVKPPLFVDYGENLHIGARTFVNSNLTALDVATITIGEDCQIGPNVQLLTPTHPVDPQPRRDKLEAARPIVLGDNVWLGGGVIVCPGVTIGDNTVVGAGAVVTRDLPADVVAVGNPARVVREIPAPGLSAAATRASGAPAG